ncbi:ABC transporter ATP-binding protein, partial [Actinotignum timonense]|nr:ABC transporter ATP-binding protein [Actinotignum timonense]
MKFVRKSSGESRKRRAQLSESYIDALRNMSIIRLSGAGARVEKELARRGENNRTAIMKLLAANQVVIIVIEGVFGL